MDRNKAIKVLKDFWSVYAVGTEIREAFETLVPELKESEDEKTRKEMIFYFQEEIPQCSIQEHADKMKEFIAWLEKQGSQNLANSAKTCKIEQKPTLPGFEEQEGVAGRDYIPVEWVEAIENYGKWKIVRTDEQKPAWSEEDEATISRSISIVRWAADGNHSYAIINKQGADELVERLKSLKDRYTWKPSDEQMHYLSWIANIKLGDGVVEQEVSKHLNELLNDLKKLKG